MLKTTKKERGEEKKGPFFFFFFFSSSENALVVRLRQHNELAKMFVVSGVVMQLH